MQRYLFIASEVVEDKAIDNGSLADRLVAEHDDLALDCRIILHL
jgi:hypothetical protein